MTPYKAPIQDIEFVLTELADIDKISQLPGYEGATPDMVSAILEEAGKLGSEVLAPLNQIGDQQGSQFSGGEVTTPDGFKEAYRQFTEHGWQSLSQSPEYGGQGLPHLLQSAVAEIWGSANLAFSLCPLLSIGGIEAIETHASKELKDTYLPKLVSGEWTATMNLTEPQAGSDLSAITTRAVAQGNHYLIKGQKIYISWGNHDLTDNIIHLVLARLPDAPEGVKGISLFLVPKFLVNEDGSAGNHNHVRTLSIEHKMGLHASPTCIMSYGETGDSVGYLIGREHEGLACMFTMMNAARLGVGAEGLSLGERAYQQAVAYARERVQGYTPGIENRVPILNHPDVRRMLMCMRAYSEAMRAIIYLSASTLDIAHRTDGETAAYHQKKLDLLIPIAKAWCTDQGQEVASLGIQVHGGMGYIEETGAAQHLRDARITSIYEGTNGIQAADLVFRKILRDGGSALGMLIEEIKAFEREQSTEISHIDLHGKLAEARTALETSAQYILSKGNNPAVGASAASAFLMLMGTVLAGWLLCKGALAANKKISEGAEDTGFYGNKVLVCRFYMEHLLPRYKGYMDSVLAGEASVLGMNLEDF